MYCRLPPVEIWAYYILWAGGIFYSMYNVHRAGDELGYWKTNEFLGNGWSFLGRKKDISDFEWSAWKPFLSQLAPWIFVHLMIAPVIRWLSIQLLPLWYLTISALFILLTFGPEALLFLMLQPCLMYLILQTRSRATIYTVGMFSLILINTDLMLEWLNMGYMQQYFILISSSWMIMRVQSFCHDRLTSQKPASVADFILFLSYCFYLPLMFLGPLLLFEKFEEGVTRASEPLKLSHIIRFGCNLMRYTAWMCVYELLLHYVYVSALQMEQKHIFKLGAWAHYGMAYAAGTLFFLKYVVTYGLSITVARFENFDAPNPPKCIAHIHLYGEMWRTFDEGLYFFLKRYIYVPLLGSKPGILRKLFSSFMCFSFVYVWHRTYWYILIWSAMNYAGIAVEIMARHNASHMKYQHIEKSVLSPENIRRFHAFLGSILFIMSALSNMYFFTGTFVGNHYIKRLLRASWQERIILVFFTYCLSQVSIETKRLSQKKKNKSEECSSSRGMQQ